MSERFWSVRSSLFLKVLLVFVGGFTAIFAYFVVSYWIFEGDSRHSLQEAAANYGRLVVLQVAESPDSARARGLAQRFGVKLRVSGPNLDWASDPEMPRFEDLVVRRVTEDGTRLVEVGRSGFGVDLVEGEHRFLVAFDSVASGFGPDTPAEHVADGLAMVAVLAAVYVLIRRLLRPVRVLSDGVERIRLGDLDVEMETRRTDELGQLIRSFNQMAKAVRDRIRARDQLLIDVSHEIRSPLTRMRVALEMTPDSSAKRSVIEDIDETEAMIDELLETERLDSPHGGLERARVDVAELLSECVQALDASAPGVELRGADRPLPATVDQERLRVLVTNLVTNALKYSDPAGPPVRVALDALPSGVAIAVHDHGVGIAEEDLANVFEPFYRVDRSRSKESGGYGIGLSLAKRIAEAHGGTIELSSTVGRGTSVLVTIPVGGNGVRPHPRW